MASDSGLGGRCAHPVSRDEQLGGQHPSHGRRLVDMECSISDTFEQFRV
jgi:hypothetical protein